MTHRIRNVPSIWNTTIRVYEHAWWEISHTWSTDLEVYAYKDKSANDFEIAFSWYRGGPICWINADIELKDIVKGCSDSKLYNCQITFKHETYQPAVKIG